MLNGKTLFIGDKLSELRVTAIDKESVTLVGASQTNVLTSAPSRLNATGHFWLGAGRGYADDCPPMNYLRKKCEGSPEYARVAPFAIFVVLGFLQGQFGEDHAIGFTWARRLWAPG